MSACTRCSRQMCGHKKHSMQSATAKNVLVAPHPLHFIAYGNIWCTPVRLYAAFKARRTQVVLLKASSVQGRPGEQQAPPVSWLYTRIRHNGTQCKMKIPPPVATLYQTQCATSLEADRNLVMFIPSLTPLFTLNFHQCLLSDSNKKCPFQPFHLYPEALTPTNAVAAAINAQNQKQNNAHSSRHTNAQQTPMYCHCCSHLSFCRTTLAQAVLLPLDLEGSGVPDIIAATCPAARMEVLPAQQVGDLALFNKSKARQ